MSAAAGVLSGLAAAVFLILLDWATRAREGNPSFLWALPAAGFLIGILYHSWGKEIERGAGLILDEIHDPKKVLPLRMAPLVLIGTLLTHLFGGSAGREGTAVQMGASLSDQLSRIFALSPHERRILLRVGAGAGFGAAIGAPWAGAVFGLEVFSMGCIRFQDAIFCALASFIAYITALGVGAPHSQFASFSIPAWSWSGGASAAGAGILFGLMASLFILATHFVERSQSRIFRYPPLRPLMAGILLVILFTWEGSGRYSGLGIPVIQEALRAPASWQEPLFKAGFTALTVGSGFKGGEFVPLVFIGTTLGSFLAAWIPLALPLLAALGFAAVFGAAANTPLACSLMAMEIFGWKIAPFALLACYSAYFASGKQGIYGRKKNSRRQTLPFRPF